MRVNRSASETVMRITTEMDELSSVASHMTASQELVIGGPKFPTHLNASLRLRSKNNHQPNSITGPTVREACSHPEAGIVFSWFGLGKTNACILIPRLRGNLRQSSISLPP